MSENPRTYPDKLEVKPLERPFAATVRVPGSKSITNRALVLAALSDPERGSQLDGVLQSEDTEVMVDALRALGFRLTTDWPNCSIQIRRGAAAHPIPARKADLFVGNSGTTMRFLTAMLCAGMGHYRLDGVTRMRERPIEDLLVALRQLGARVRSERDDGFPPVKVDAYGLPGGRARISGAISSQFLSAVLMVAPLAKAHVTVEVEGTLVSQPYVEMTVRMMKEFGVLIETDGATHFHMPVRPWYDGLHYQIEPDASAASYFFAAAAITQGQVIVPNLSMEGLQGDVRFVNLLDEMGCHVKRRPDRITVKGWPLHGIDADMNAISDTVMTLAAVACFAEGPTTIRNVAHIRHKETDRLAALSTELRRLGAEVDEFADGLTITPRPLHGAEIETYNDHRMAMSMALIGLRVPGVVIKNPGCVAKTYPGFWDDLEKLRA
jgi:3-phosphoshikimate 1-carboxyvinyltransferase